MNYTINTKDTTRTNVNGVKEVLKVVVSITLDVASHPAGKARKDEAALHTSVAMRIVEELRTRHSIEAVGIEAVRSLNELDAASAMSASDAAALFRACDLLAYADKLIRVTLSASALSLALQGVGPYAKFVTNAVRKSVRSYLLLDSID